jgi:hypothetical protein
MTDEFSARWIWLHDEDWLNRHARFRKHFTLSAPPQKALFHLTADVRYRLYVNGRPVADGPARCFPDRQSLDELDLTAHLQVGANALAVHVLSLGLSTHQSVFRGRAGLFVAGVVECADRSELAIVSDVSWRAKPAAAYRRRAARFTAQTGFQEHVDLRREELLDWTHVEFPDETWPHAAVLGPAGCLPWPEFEPRDIPLLEIRPAPRPRLLGAWIGANAPEFAEVANAAALAACEEARPAEMQTGENLRQAWEACGRLVLPPSEGFLRLLFDFGETMYGRPVLEADEAAGDEILDLAYGETLRDKGFLVFMDDRVRGGQADRLICRAGKNRFRSFQPRGMRFLLLTARRVRRPLKLNELRWETLGFPAEQKGSFSCSDPLLNRIWRTGIATLRACTSDVFMEEPCREQASSTAGARIAALLHYHAFGEAVLPRRSLLLAAQSQLPNGLLYGVFPAEAPGCVPPDFTLHWIRALDEYHFHTGDLAALRLCRKTLENALSFFARHAGERGLLGPTPEWRLFLDLAPGLDRRGLSATFNLLYLQALAAATRIGLALSESGLANHCRQAATTLAERIKTVFGTSEGSLLVESVDLDTGEPSDLVSQQATALAVLEGLLPGQSPNAALAVKELLSMFPAPPCTKVEAGPIRAGLFFRHFVHEAQARLGYGADALADIRNTWGWMLVQGAATWWKTMPPRANGGLCHAWSAHPTVFLTRHVLGFSPAEAGWRRIRFAPKFFDLTSAAGGAPTPAGTVECAWERDEKRAKFRLVVPSGLKAECRMPGEDRPRLLDSGTHEWEAECK